MIKSKTIVFIHGLWLHRSSWEQWMEFFTQQGYTCYNPGWPGDSDTVAECHTNAAAIANRGVKEVADSYAAFIATLPEPPIVIGHSFGGLLAQILLGRGIAAAGIALDPAPIKGVWQLPISALRASLPVLGNPFNITKTHTLSFDEYRFAFANAIPEQEARELFERWFIPAPCRPLFQAGLATLVGNETAVDTANTTRGPLLITGGEKDNVAPPIFGQASARKYNSSVVTDYKLFAGRGHSLIIDHGWKEIAEYSLAWLRK